MADLKYKPDGDKLKAYMKSNSFVRALRGPVGSGKSVGSCVELMRRALMQEPDEDGVRKTRWAIIRNTNPQLKTTTIKTWLDWFPEKDWGRFNWSPPFTHHIKRGDLDAEFIFLALDRPDDVKKLLSLELTGCFINEAREVPKEIVDAATMRVDRFPSRKDGGCTWAGVIMDTNAPEDDHWWPVMAGDSPLPDHVTREQALMLQRPDNWEFFTQPEGLLEEKNDDGEVTGYIPNPNAENRKFLSEDYYLNIITGKTKAWIDVYVMNRLGRADEGKAVYPDFRRDMHVAEEDIPYSPAVPFTIGMDFGLTPAAVVMQNIRGRWLVLRELVAFDMGAARFGTELKRFLAQEFPDHCGKYINWGDPAGDFRAQTDEQTPFQVLRAAGVSVREAPTNDPSLRIEAVASTLCRLVDQKSGILIDQRCRYLIKGFEGGYHYKKLNLAGHERYGDTPEKDNRFSHVHDALQYGLCGGGESRKLLSSGDAGKVAQVARSSPLDRRATVKRKRPSFTRMSGV